jgi:hypothetical protein
MSSFEYTAVNATHTDRFRQFINLYGEDRQSHSGVFTISGSLPEESYPQETSLPFQPEAILVAAVYPGAGTAATNLFFFGVATNTGRQWGIKVKHYYLTSTLRESWFSDSQILPEVAEITSFEPDGFIFNVANPLGFDLDVLYLALAGGGRYDCGVQQSPGGTGLEAVTTDFSPSAVLFANDHLGGIGHTFLWSRFMIGAGDIQGHNYGCWDGSASGDIYTNQVDQPYAVFMAKDAGLNLEDVAVSYHPVVRAAATLGPVSPTGFTLDWAIADATYYYGWMAFQQAEVGRWTYNHTSGQTGSVPTSYKPKGLIFFCNDLAHEQLTEYNPPTNGASNGVGFCDMDLNQGDCGYQDVDAPPFRHPQTAGNRDTNTAFGTMGRRSGTLAGDFLHDRGHIFELAGSEFNPIVGMNYRSAVRRGHRGRFHHTRHPG